MASKRTLGELMRAARKQAGYDSQTEVAVELARRGINRDQRTISAWENDTSRPSPEALGALLDIYDPDAEHQHADEWLRAAAATLQPAGSDDPDTPGYLSRPAFPPRLLAAA